MPTPRLQRGFTLIELVTSLVVMSLLMFGMASAMMLATRAIPNGQAPAQEVRKTATVLDEMAEDLRVAQYVTERTARAITFTVPDRDGDGVPEVIRYAWSGTAGHPLVRFYNDAVDGAEVLADVHEFDLEYDLFSEDDAYPGPLVEGSEIEVSSYTIETPVKEYRIEADKWVGQYFVPTLPPSALSWSPTRVLVFGKRDGVPQGETHVQLRLPDGDGLPSDTVLEERSLWEAYLGNAYGWEEVEFFSASGLAPDQGLCLVFEWAFDDIAAVLRGDDGTGLLETGDAGVSWGPKNETLLYYVYGQAVTPGAGQTLTRDSITAVRIEARAGPSPSSLVETAVQTLNRPEALTAVWLTDFEADPTKLDLDLDGAADWAVAGGDPFDEGGRSNGAWMINGQLNTNPGCDFDEPTTVEVRFRDVSNEGEAGGVKLRVDRDGDTHALIQAEIETDGAGGQKLTVWTFDPGLDLTKVVTAAGLPDDWVDLRLLVDPTKNYFNVRINGRDHGTHEYGRITAATDDVIFLYETAPISGIKFDDVLIRVGGAP